MYVTLSILFVSMNKLQKLVRVTRYHKLIRVIKMSSSHTSCVTQPQTKSQREYNHFSYDTTENPIEN